MGVEQIKVYSDSQLVVNQVLQQYEAREDNMVAYLDQVRKLIAGLKGLSISQIPREENAQADRLAHLASSSKVGPSRDKGGIPVRAQRFSSGRHGSRLSR